MFVYDDDDDDDGDEEEGESSPPTKLSPKSSKKTGSPAPLSLLDDPIKVTLLCGRGGMNAPTPSADALNARCHRAMFNSFTLQASTQPQTRDNCNYSAALLLLYRWWLPRTVVS